MGGKTSKRRGKEGKERGVTERLFEPKEVAEAFRFALGSVAQAARDLDCDRTTLYLYCREYPEVQKALEEARTNYKDTCLEFAKDNHLTQLMDGNREVTAYEIAKLDPKPDGLNLDLSKLTQEQVVMLHHLLQLAKPDGVA